MPRRRTHRLATTFLVVLSLLFSQLALAAYTCPGQDGAAAMAEAMAAGLPCEDMDPQQPVLCHDHAVAAVQAAEPFQAPTPSLPALVQVLAVAPLLTALEAQALPATGPAQARPPPEPLFLATRRLRV